MRPLSIICLFLITLHLNSQILKENFAIGQCLEVFNNDSIKIYFGEDARVVDKSCATYFRVGKIDRININVEGLFSDYYLNGKVAFTCSMVNDYLNGIAVSYYKTGTVKSTGIYKDDHKTGLWKFYYENGKLQKVIDFRNGQPFIIDYYTKSSKQKVTEGNGTYSGEFLPFRSGVPLKIGGAVKDGKMVGRWILNTSNPYVKVAEEFYENGQFLKGISQGLFTEPHQYTDEKRILIEGFCPYENLLLDENSLTCQNKSSYSNWPLSYNTNGYRFDFYRDLQDSIRKVFPSHLDNQWFIVGLLINAKSECKELNIKSSINDSYAELLLFRIIKSMTNWIATKIDDKAVDTYLFFSILIRQDQKIIPVEYYKENKIIFK